MPDGPKKTSCTVTTFDAAGMGSCTVTYHPSEVSGMETITAKAEDFPDAEPKKINVAVTGLAEMGAGSGTLVLVGAPNNHAGTNDPCRSPAPTSRHFENHFGRPLLILVVEGIAHRMFRETGILLRVNDMSLQFGGLFDIDNDWRTPHRGHRVGVNADVGFTGIRNGVCVSYNRARLLEAIVENARRAPLIEGNHFHVRLP